MRVLRFQRWTKSEYAFSIVLVVSKLSFAVLKHPTYTSLLASGVSMVRIDWIAKDARQALRSRNVMQTGKADGTHNQTAWNRPSSPLLIACCLVAGYPSLAPFKKCGGIAQHGFHLRVTSGECSFGKHWGCSVEHAALISRDHVLNVDEGVIATVSLKHLQCLRNHIA